MNKAPIALFVFNRFDHVKRTLEALTENHLAQNTDIIVYSDGPKVDADQFRITQIRQYLKTLHGFKSVRVIERSENFGLSRSIIQGVTEVLETYGRLIVLEDDMVTSPYFLLYMNDALELYENENRVISIQGYIFSLKEALPQTFFLRGADCWGWATWKRGWDFFEPDGRILLTELKKKKLTNLFDYDGVWNYMEMLQSHIQGRNDSWAIRWHASAFLQEKLALYPNRSLVRNIGLDSTGTHCETSKALDVTLTTQRIEVCRIPIEENIMAREAIKAFLRSIKPSHVEKMKKVFLRAIYQRVGSTSSLQQILMNSRTKKLFAGCLPPFAIEAIRRRRNTIWSGRYSTWEEAKAASAGYESEIILARVKEALLRVKDGEASCERDSVLFDKTQYSWPLLAGLMWIAAQCEGNLNLLDFGGSLGSTYFQNKKFLLSLPRVSWNIVEQPHFVAEGKNHFENETLRFYDDIESCVREKNPYTVLFSGVLQYLENPYAILEKVKALAFPFVLCDRTGFIDVETDRLTIQRVPPTIYHGSYPCWFFSRRKFTSFFEDAYELVEEFDALAGVMHLEGKEVAIDKGLILKRRSWP